MQRGRTDTITHTKNGSSEMLDRLDYRTTERHGYYFQHVEGKEYLEGTLNQITVILNDDPTHTGNTI